MGIWVYETATIYDSFKTLIKSGNYEKLILDIMNASTKIFPNQYEHVENQSNGECDFIDISTRKKYDVKLLSIKSKGN